MTLCNFRWFWEHSVKPCFKLFSVFRNNLRLNLWHLWRSSGRSLTATSSMRVPLSMQRRRLTRALKDKVATWGLPHSPFSAFRSSSYLIHLSNSCSDFNIVVIICCVQPKELIDYHTCSTIDWKSENITHQLDFVGDCQNSLILVLWGRHIQIDDRQNWFSRITGCVTPGSGHTSPNTKGEGVSSLLLPPNLSPKSRGEGGHGPAIGGKVTK